MGYETEHIIERTTAPSPGELGQAMRRFGTEVIVGHPTFRNESTIGRLLYAGIEAASRSFGGRRVTFVVSDGTLTESGGDASTLEAAIASARTGLEGLPKVERESVQVIATPYDGYGGDRTPGKGSALKLVFDEMGETEASLLVLLDGDLRNDMAAWHRVFATVERSHQERYGERPMFVTARYARHFVDASLTRFIVGPLTTLMGTYVPGGISGDIALSAAAVEKERRATWTPARRRYGTDISTTFDNLADPDTVIYEVALGAKLHDITDEAKLSVMPGQVIGAALDRLIHWQRADGRVLELARANGPLRRVETWGPERTGIGFVDPGETDVFDLDAKRAGLVGRFDEFAPDIEAVAGPEQVTTLRERVAAMAADAPGDDAPVELLGVDQDRWIDLLQRAVAHALATEDAEAARRALNYLYTAAFLEFVKDRLHDLGLETFGAVRRAQARLGVPADRAERFYSERVDAVADGLAFKFFERRARIVELVEHFRSEVG